MRNDEFSMIYAYLYNNQSMLEDTLKQLQANVRFRRIDTNDCIEVLLASARLELFNEVVHDLCALLSIFDKRKKGGKI